jgi:hypothetical protein
MRQSLRISYSIKKQKSKKKMTPKRKKNKNKIENPLKNCLSHLKFYGLRKVPLLVIPERRGKDKKDQLKIVTKA